MTSLGCMKDEAILFMSAPYEYWGLKPLCLLKRIVRYVKTQRVIDALWLITDCMFWWREDPLPHLN